MAQTMKSIISLTTIPSRVKHIKPCIDSLLDQKLPVYVWIQEKVERTGNVFDGETPSFLNQDGVNVAVVKEMGPITKLLPGLRLSEIVITADDDHIYGRGWAEGLIKQSKKFPDACLCYRGRVFNGKSYKSTKVIANPDLPTPVEFVTGVKGALYKDSFFEDSIFDEWKEYMYNDDIVISAHLKKRDVPMIVIPTGCEIKPYDVRFVNNLWDGVNSKHNDEGLEKVYW